MSEHLAWALDRAREQTLTLVADISPDALRPQASPEERHPIWILGHLLLADTYLLFLLTRQPLAADFPALLDRYGPTSPRNALHDEPKQPLVDRLRQTNQLRVAQVSAMTSSDLSAPLSDEFLARAQPTIGHHLQSLVFHEGYHAGQVSSWRKTHGFAPVRWMLGP